MQHGMKTDAMHGGTGATQQGSPCECQQMPAWTTCHHRAWYDVVQGSRAGWHVQMAPHREGLHDAQRLRGGEVLARAHGAQPRQRALSECVLRGQRQAQGCIKLRAGIEPADI